MAQHQDIPADELKELQSLLRLKNYERPAEGYFEDFLDEFHRRQRMERVSEPQNVSIFQKISAWFGEMGAAKWAYGAGVAYAALMIGFFWTNNQSSPSGVTQEQEEALPGDRRLEHVDLEKPLEKNSEETLEVLPKDF